MIRKGDSMDNHFVTKHNPVEKTEELIGENLSYYEALTIVGDSRSERDGNYYYIGRPRGLYKKG